MSLLSLLQRPQKRRIRYLLRDLFTTTAVAPLATPRTAEPGPGTWTLTNTVTSGAISILSGRLKMLRPTGGQGAGNYGAISTSSFERRVGRAFYGVLNVPTMATVHLGLCNSGTLAQPRSDVTLASAGALQITANGTTFTVGASLTQGADYQIAVILRGTGEQYFIRGGTQYPNWTRLFVSFFDTYTPFWPALSNFDSALTADDFTLLDKGGVFASDFGAVTALSPFPASGDSATANADALQYFTWTPVAAETLIWRFRRTDDDNCYRLECSQSGSTIKLFRRDAGVDTELNSGKTQTFTVGTPYRIGIIYEAGQVRTFVGTTLKHVVTGEVSYLTNTNTTVAGFTLGANWELWPRVQSGTDLLTLA